MSLRDDDEIVRVSHSLKDYVGSASPELLSTPFKEKFSFKYVTIDLSNCSSFGSVKSVAAIIETPGTEPG
jgi:hypothetical protein